MVEVSRTRRESDELRSQLDKLGALSLMELEKRKGEVKSELQELISRAERVRLNDEAQRAEAQQQLEALRRTMVLTEDLGLLQEVGIYQYRHPLTDVVQYEGRLAELQVQIKDMVKKDGGAVESAQDWHVNGSVTQGRAMVRDFSKLMLRAFNAEADNLVRGLKPHKLDSAIDRLNKVAEAIERLGKIMQIRISSRYRALRIRELELTADFVQKQAEQKESERLERERLREEKKVEQEMERERQRLEKERTHYENAMQKLVAKGDETGAARLRAELERVESAIRDVDYRAANIRAGYVYVISNIGSFGESMVKVGMTRRLDPLDRIRELSDASVPFNFDVHALFFSKDAVGIETSLHERLAEFRVNLVNRRREFFSVTPGRVKEHLAELTGELLEYHEVPEALEYRRCLGQRRT